MLATFFHSQVVTTLIYTEYVPYCATFSCIQFGRREKKKKSESKSSGDSHHIDLLTICFEKMWWNRSDTTKIFNVMFDNTNDNKNKNADSKAGRIERPDSGKTNDRKVEI